MPALAHWCRVVSSLLLAGLTACGGGGGGGAPGAAPASSVGVAGGTTLIGTVVDGYIEGATVCLDLDASGACDPGEPAGVTGPDGRYQVDLGPHLPQGRHLVAEIPATARDSDHGGLTLAEAGASAYRMAAPAEQGAVVNPFTTLMIGLRQAGLATDMAAAHRHLVQALQLPPGADLHPDPTTHPQLRRTARQLALQLQRHTQPQDAGAAAKALAWQLSTAPVGARSAGAHLPGDLLATADAPPAVAPLLAQLAHSQDVQLLSYSLPRLGEGQAVTASALLLTPRQAPPASGWPLLVLSPGTTGLAARCAPSGGHLDAGQLRLVDALLARGMAVVLPDLEGRGPSGDGSHPFLQVRSAGRAMALAALASRHHLGSRLSGAWAAAGHAQGGHAALAAAQYAGLAEGMRYRGTAALAPHAGLLAATEQAMQDAASATYGRTEMAYIALTSAYTTLAPVLQGAAIAGAPLDTAALLRAGLPGAPRTPPVLGLQELARRAADACHSDFRTWVAQDIAHYAFRSEGPIDYPGLVQGALQNPTLKAWLADTEPGTARLPGRTLVMQGIADTVVRASATETLVSAMRQRGSDVTLARYAGVGHTELRTDARATAELVDFLHGLLN